MWTLLTAAMVCTPPFSSIGKIEVEIRATLSWSASCPFRAPAMRTRSLLVNAREVKLWSNSSSNTLLTANVHFVQSTYSATGLDQVRSDGCTWRNRSKDKIQTSARLFHRLGYIDIALPASPGLWKRVKNSAAYLKHGAIYGDAPYAGFLLATWIRSSQQGRESNYKSGAYSIRLFSKHSTNSGQVLIKIYVPLDSYIWCYQFGMQRFLSLQRIAFMIAPGEINKNGFRDSSSRDSNWQR